MSEANCLTCKSLGRVYDEPRYACIQFYPCVNGDKYEAREVLKMWAQNGGSTRSQTLMFDVKSEMAIAIERERCAKICDLMADAVEDYNAHIAQGCADEIRRG